MRTVQQSFKIEFQHGSCRKRRQKRRGERERETERERQTVREIERGREN